MMEGIYELKMYCAFGLPVETPSLGSKNFKIASFDSQKKKKRKEKSNFLTHLEEEVSSRQEFYCRSVGRRRFRWILHSRPSNRWRWRSFQWWNKCLVHLISWQDLAEENRICLFFHQLAPTPDERTFEGAVLKPLIKNSSWIKGGARWLTFKSQTTTVLVL